MAVRDLTTLTNVKQYLLQSQSSVTTSDNLLKQLITACSSMIYAYLNRPPFIKTTFTQVRNGLGNQRMMLKNWPVLSVSQLVINGQVIPAANPLVANAVINTGWLAEPWEGIPPGRPSEIDLEGYAFSPNTWQAYFFVPGYQNIQVTYAAGYTVTGEAQIITLSGSNYQVQPLIPYGNWIKDEGVTYANGTALVYTTGTPAQGQYSITSSSTPITYNFNAADNNASILLSYDYVPYDVEQACIELVAERFTYSNRIGENSKSIAGQTSASYKPVALNPFVQALLNPYRQVAILY